MPEIRKTVILNRQEIEQAAIRFACEMGYINVPAGESAGLILINDHDGIKLTIEVQEKARDTTPNIPDQPQYTTEDHGSDMGNSPTDPSLPSVKNPYKLSRAERPSNAELFNQAIRREIEEERRIDEERSLDPGL